MQILTDVFAEIDEQHRVNVKDEDPADMVMRMLGFLKVVKYKPDMSL